MGARPTCVRDGRRCVADLPPAHLTEKYLAEWEATLADERVEIVPRDTARALLAEIRLLQRDGGGATLVERDDQDESFTYFHEDGPMTVPQTNVMSTFMAARDAVRVWREGMIEGGFDPSVPFEAEDVAMAEVARWAMYEEAS